MDVWSQGKRNAVDELGEILGFERHCLRCVDQVNVAIEFAEGSVRRVVVGWPRSVVFRLLPIWFEWDDPIRGILTVENVNHNQLKGVMGVSHVDLDTVLGIVYRLTA